MDHTSTEESREGSPKSSRLGWKAWLGFAVYVLLLPGVLFLAAGRLNWAMAWVYVGIVLFFSISSRVVVALRYPELLTERAQSLGAEGVKDWDRYLVAVVALLGPMATWTIAGLDERCGWSNNFPLPLQLSALSIVVVGSLLATWAMAENRFFSALVRIQKEREHSVITTGPYRFIRHPGYAGAILFHLVTPVVLNSAWAFIPVLGTTVALLVRTELEDHTLRRELQGYAEYVEKTRYRLVPGIW